MSVQKQKDKKKVEKETIPESSKVFLSQELEEEREHSPELTEEKSKKKSSKSESKKSKEKPSYPGHKHSFNTTEGKKEILSGLVSLVPKSVIKRVIKEELAKKGDFRLTRGALDVMQEAFEYEATNLFFVANQLAKNRGQQTLLPRDVILARHINKIGSNGLSIHTPNAEFEKLIQLKQNDADLKAERAEKKKEKKDKKDKSEKKDEKEDKKDKEKEKTPKKSKKSK